ncbi:hypothetical protein [Pseudomonas sp. IT-P253]|uniref:hypothetical protein n=1 Tax=Pseudomonas sp. IT-P253 TaxID=3026455 RepID=UPI0039E04748
MSDKRLTEELLQKGLLRDLHEGFNVNPPGNRNALPASVPKAPPQPPEKPKNG